MIATKSRPLAVLISDVHFNLKTRHIAAQALTMALGDAEQLQVPLIIAGDLHDTKAILRGECISTIISILKGAKVPVKVLIGNHDKLHEKSHEHALEFLRPYVDLIDSTRVIDANYNRQIGFIPYQSTNEAFLEELKQFHPGTILICHQGFNGAFMGEYVKDESSVHPDDVAKFRVVSGHYHRHQSLGTITYIGTPYTTTFAEANDGPKGHVILFYDGTIDQVPVDLRRHIIIECTTDTIVKPSFSIKSDDIIWLKVKGLSVDLATLDKRKLGQKLFGHANFKLDKIATDVDSVEVDTENLTDEEIMDSIIDQDTQSNDNKAYLKSLWRELMK